MGLSCCLRLGRGRPVVLLLLNLFVSSHAGKIRIVETRLEQTRTSPIYRARLRAGWELLESWLLTKKLSSVDWTRDLKYTNQILADFVQDMHDSQDVKLWIVRHALLSVQTFHRSLQGRIRRPWDGIASWQMEVPLRSRVAVDMNLLQGLFISAIDWALQEPSLAVYLIPLAVLARIIFFAVLRFGEGMKLLVSDLYFPRREHIQNPKLPICIRNPKNRTTMGRVQYSIIDDPETIEWARWLTRGLHPNVKLWPSSPANFRKWFNLLLKRMGIHFKRLGPGGLRGGGATFKVMNGYSSARLQEIGRWANSRNMQIYLQEAMAALVMNQLPEYEAQNLDTIIEEGSRVWHSPPQVPWWSLFSRARQWHMSRLMKKMPSGNL